MRNRYRILLQVITFSIGVIGLSQAETPYHGDLKLGYVFKDDDGNRSVMQPSYNVYEGAALSLENFLWQFDGGTRLTADLRSLTLNNRGVSVRLIRPGSFGFSVRHSQYRRVYSLDGDSFTRRRNTAGDFWVQPIRQLRLFGSLGLESKSGAGAELFEPSALEQRIPYDYDRTRARAGFRLSERRSVLQAEYQGSTSNAESGALAARNSKRYKVTAASPMPRLNRLLLHGGFQHYEWTTIDDTTKLSSNTVWGGGRVAVTKALSIKYSFVFDRTSYTSDPIAADNLSHALTAEYAWPRKAGVSAGYVYKTNDNLTTEKRADTYLASGWYHVTPELKVQGGYGALREDIQEGSTLAGPADVTKYYGGVKYFRQDLQANFKIESRKTSNDEIGSTADLVRIGTDVQGTRKEWGSLSASYTYQRGDFKSAENAFAFADHAVSAEGTTVYYRKFQVSGRVTYYRSKRDLNVESIFAGLTGRYKLASDLTVEAGFDSYTYDDLLLTTATYTRYYSANTVELKVIKSF